VRRRVSASSTRTATRRAHSVWSAPALKGEQEGIKCEIAR
jgi:hypothetical protein